MCTDILRRCGAIIFHIQKIPNVWDLIVGNHILTVDDRLEIADQVFDIRQHVDRTLSAVDRCLQEGYHPFEISRLVVSKVKYLSRWIDTIVEGRGLPQRLTRV